MTNDKNNSVEAEVTKVELAEKESNIAKELAIFAGNQIKTRRKQLRMSQTALGDLVGLTFQQVQKYEHGSNRLPLGRVFDICIALDISPLSLFHGFPHTPAYWLEPISMVNMVAPPEVVNAMQVLNAHFASAVGEKV